MSADFLLELGTEELPPKNLRRLMDALRDNVVAGLQQHELSFGDVHAYASPRRLAVLVEQLAAQTPQKELTVWGPPAKIAFDENGEPTKAALAFAQKNGIPASDLRTENDGKADKLVVRQTVGGQSCTELLGDIVNDAATRAVQLARGIRGGRGVSQAPDETPLALRPPPDPSASTRHRTPAARLAAVWRVDRRSGPSSLGR